MVALAERGHPQPVEQASGRTEESVCRSSGCNHDAAPATGRRRRGPGRPVDPGVIRPGVILGLGQQPLVGRDRVVFGPGVPVRPGEFVQDGRPEHVAGVEALASLGGPQCTVTCTAQRERVRSRGGPGPPRSGAAGDAGERLGRVGEGVCRKEHLTLLEVGFVGDTRFTERRRASHGVGVQVGSGPGVAGGGPEAGVREHGAARVRRIAVVRQNSVEVATSVAGVAGFLGEEAQLVSGGGPMGGRGPALHRRRQAHGKRFGRRRDTAREAQATQPGAGGDVIRVARTFEERVVGPPCVVPAGRGVGQVGEGELHSRRPTPPDAARSG